MTITTLKLAANDHRFNKISTVEGEPVYWIETSKEHVFSTNPTFIYKANPEGQGRELLATLQFHQLGVDTITFEGKQHQLADMFVRKDWPSSSRLIKMGGEVWKWSIDMGRPELFGPQPRRCMAAYHRSRHVLQASDPVLDIDDEAFEFLDLIVIGWVVMMHDDAEGRRYH